MGVNRINVNKTDSNYTHSIFDISEYTGRSYDTLSDALADVPEGKRNGGMTIRYIIDNRYVQYRLMATSFSTNENDWQDENNIAISKKDVVNADLDFTDKDSNIILRLKNGHIQTKNFNSEDIKQNVVIVDVNGNGKYSSITEASASEPANTVFMIMPGVYDDENVQGCDIKKQYFIGLDRDSTIVKNHQNGTNNCVFTIGAGCLKNLTIIKEYSQSAVVEPNSYAVHADSILMSNETFSIENCFVKSEGWACAVGMGMNGGCHVTFKNSYFVATNPVSPAAYAHDNYREEVIYDGIQTWTMINCIFYAPNGQEAIGFQSMCHVNSIYNIEMIRTRLKSLNTQKPYWIRNIGETEPTAQDFLGLVNGRLIETSWGNSCSDFNND